MCRCKSDCRQCLSDTVAAVSRREADNRRDELDADLLPSGGLKHGLEVHATTNRRRSSVLHRLQSNLHPLHDVFALESHFGE